MNLVLCKKKLLVECMLEVTYRATPECAHGPALRQCLHLGPLLVAGID